MKECPPLDRIEEAGYPPERKRPEWVSTFCFSMIHIKNNDEWPENKPHKNQSSRSESELLLLFRISFIYGWVRNLSLRLFVFPPLPYYSLLHSPAVFIDHVAVDPGTPRKGAIGAEVIPLFAQLEPLAGNHAAVRIKAVGFIVAAFVDILPAGEHFVPGVISPVTAVLDPAGFQRSVCFKEILRTFDDLYSGESLAVPVIKPLSGVVPRPALGSGGVDGQLDKAVEHGADFSAGGGPGRRLSWRGKIGRCGE